jgi:hypothetical protein
MTYDPQGVFAGRHLKETVPEGHAAVLAAE